MNTSSHSIAQNPLESLDACSRSLATWNDLRERRIEQIEAAVFQAMKHPIDFPSIETAIIPDDRVCLPVDPELPQAVHIVAAVVRYLLKHGVLLKNVCVLLSPPVDAVQFTKQIIEMHSELAEIHVVAHDRADQPALAYLAASPAGEPIHVHRELTDADVVLPICLAKTNQLEWRRNVEFVYPQFSNESTNSRFAEQAELNSEAANQLLAEEAADAMRFLGSYLVIQVGAGLDEGIIEIVSGQRKPTMAAANTAAQNSWHRELESTCQLLIAQIPPHNICSWNTLYQIASRYSEVLEECGTLVIACRFSKRGSMSQETDPVRGPRMPRSTAKHFRKLLEEFHIFLYSDLTREVTESHGFGYVESIDQVDRLAETVDRCLVVPDAIRASVSVA